MAKRLLLLTSLFWYAISASAIIVQHDIPIAEYAEFAQDKRFEAVGMIKSKLGGCTATLIDPYSLLTAAHCLEHSIKSGNFEGSSFRIGNPLGDKLKISGARLPDRRLEHKTFFGHSSLKTDLAVVYLAKPIRFVKSAQLATEDWNAPISLEFAGYGLLVNGKTDEELELGTKYAGRTEVAGVCEDTRICGMFNWRDDLALNACPTQGDSGASMMINDATGSKIIAVNTGEAFFAEEDFSDKSVPYTRVWFAEPIYPHLDFLRDAMPYREVITTGKSDNWMMSEAWSLLGSNDIFSEEVDNHVRHDHHGMHKRNFKAIVQSKINLYTSRTISELDLRRDGWLHLDSKTSLRSVQASVEGIVHFRIDEGTPGYMQTKNLQFNGGAIHITFDLVQPNQKSSNDVIDLKLPTRLVGAELAGSGTTSFHIARELESFEEPPKKVRKWKLFSSEGSDISGKPTFHFFNPPTGYDVQLIQEARVIYVQITPLPQN